jgi:hypothetical protein
MRTRSMKFAALLAALGVMTLGLSGVMAAPVGAQGYKRVEKITYVGSAVDEYPVAREFKCAGYPPPGPGVGCVWAAPSPGEKFVAVAIQDAVAPDVSAELVQVHWEDETQGGHTEWGVFHRFCTTTGKRIKLLPKTNRILVVLWEEGKCPNTAAAPAFATSGEVTITFTRSR